MLVLAVAVAVSVVSVGQGPQPALADPVDRRKSTVDQQIVDLKETLEGANAEFVEAAIVLRKAQAKLAAAREVSAAARRQLTAAITRDTQLASQLAFAEAEQAKAEADLSTQRDTQARTRRTLGQIARRAYTGDTLDGLAIVLHAASPEQLTDRVVVARTALRAQNDALNRLSVQRAELQARTDRLNATSAQVNALKGESVRVIQERRQAQDDAAAAQAQVAGLVAQEQQAVDDIQSRITGEKKRLQALAAEQASLKAILLARAKAAAEAERRRGRAQRPRGSGGASDAETQAPPGAGPGYLSNAANGPITSGYGMRYHPILHIYRLHSGIDFGIDCGTPVYAAAPGEVISAGWAGGYGNRVVIDHGRVRGVDLATTYNHLTRVAVNRGGVSRGQLIGYSGTTGLSTGCHLHFETLADGEYVDPRGWL